MKLLFNYQYLFTIYINIQHIYLIRIFYLFILYSTEHILHLQSIMKLKYEIIVHRPIPIYDIHKYSAYISDPNFLSFYCILNPINVKILYLNWCENRRNQPNYRIPYTICKTYIYVVVIKCCSIHISCITDTKHDNIYNRPNQPPYHITYTTSTTYIL